MKKLYAVIGSPIAHSMSPVMHNNAFKQLGVDAHYHAFHVESEQLADVVKGFRALGVSGFNVTIPHKTSIIPLLDKVDELAKQIGAVNTVINENGQLIGYNTDGSGFVQGLKEKVSLDNQKVLIIGAGGAAKAIYYTLSLQPVKSIDICNRTVSKAAQIIEGQATNVSSQALSLTEAETVLSKYDIIIQTTNIGMHPDVTEIPIKLTNLKSTAFVSDIIYNPLETSFLQLAKTKGASIQNGIDMFVYQGALAFEKWTNIFPNIEAMRENVVRQLGGKTC